ncbi:unnamed protein product, partial [Urochloa humidicola]
ELLALPLHGSEFFIGSLPPPLPPVTHAASLRLILPVALYQRCAGYALV